jgi:hypothetical protein
MKRSSIIEGIGSLGVIAGLVFVGVEVRQATVATRAATVQQIKDAWLDVNLTIASTPELTAAMEAAEIEGFAGVDRSAQIMLQGFYRSLFHNWSNGYTQFLLGTLDSTQWQPHLRDAAVGARNPVLVEVWEEWNHVYDDRFRTLMDSLIASDGG